MLPGVVHDIIATRAVERPLSTSDVVEIYNAAHPALPQKTVAVAAELRRLYARGLADMFDGAADRVTLVERGVESPRRGWRYWTLPTT